MEGFEILFYYYIAWILCIIGLILLIPSIIILIKKKKSGIVLMVISIIFLIPISYFEMQFVQEDIRRWKALSPMQKAIEKNKYSKVKRLIEDGYNVNEEVPYTSPPTPLLYAIDKGNIQIVKLLVENGADINFITTLNSYIPLKNAVYKRDTTIVKYLLEQGVNADAYMPHLKERAIDNIKGIKDTIRSEKNYQIAVRILELLNEYMPEKPELQESSEDCELSTQ